MVTGKASWRDGDAPTVLDNRKQRAVVRDREAYAACVSQPAKGVVDLSTPARADLHVCVR